jgi:hypothetical protein
MPAMPSRIARHCPRAQPYLTLTDGPNPPLLAAANRLVSNVQRDDDTITFSGLTADGSVGAWRIVVDSAEVNRMTIPRFRTKGPSHRRGTPTGSLSHRRAASATYQWNSPATASRRNVGRSGTPPRRDGNGSRRGKPLRGPLAPRRAQLHAGSVGRVGPKLRPCGQRLVELALALLDWRATLFDLPSTHVP